MIKTFLHSLLDKVYNAFIFLNFLKIYICNFSIILINKAFLFVSQAYNCIVHFYTLLSQVK